VVEQVVVDKLGLVEQVEVDKLELVGQVVVGKLGLELVEVYKLELVDKLELVGKLELELVEVYKLVLVVLVQEQCIFWYNRFE
jgi:hypothetical protein